MTSIRPSVATLALLAVGSALSPSSAQACSIWCGPQIPHRSTIPANGGITASYECGGACAGYDCFGADEPRMLVTDTSFHEVPGTTHITPYGDGRSFALTWVPETPLTPGQLLLASPRHQQAGNHAEYHDEITVVEAMPDEPVFGNVTLKVEHFEPWSGELYCCNRDEICYESCIAQQKRGAVELTYQGGGDYQFLFRASPSPGETGNWVAAFLGGRIEFEQQQEEYCVTIEALRLVDGTIWPIADTCLPHGDLPDLEVRDTTQAEIDEWWGYATCDDHGFPVPPSETPMESRDAGGVGHSDGEAGGTGGGAGSRSQRRASDSSDGSGCQAAGASRTNPLSVLLVGLVGVAIAARRPRRVP